ncbi:hypothetical protein FGO68_gene13689 [Halteria grandinella]|uniref:Uncharacterized protein n=1 Tax=Halteria grandinella TaxID=5974 RepID=A0A8J8NZ92_HALGN|nr:hypothetical protein FGO68_gene13689 [Halteria grandinella]
MKKRIDLLCCHNSQEKAKSDRKTYSTTQKRLHLHQMRTRIDQCPLQIYPFMSQVRLECQIERPIAQLNSLFQYLLKKGQGKILFKFLPLFWESIRQRKEHQIVPLLLYFRRVLKRGSQIQKCWTYLKFLISPKNVNQSCRSVVPFMALQISWRYDLLLTRAVVLQLGHFGQFVTNIFLPKSEEIFLMWISARITSREELKVIKRIHLQIIFIII